MRGLVVLLVLAVVGVGALGFYQGWFKVSKAQTDQGQSFQVTVDKQKFKTDQERAKEKARDVAGQIKERAGAVSGKAAKETTTRESDNGRE